METEKPLNTKTTLNFNNWVDNYSDYLFSYALMKVGKREDAEDLVQETFLSALKGKENFRGEATEKTWLTIILKNKIIDYYRNASKELPIDKYLNETNKSFNSNFFDADNVGHWNKYVKENHFSSSADTYLQGKEFQEYLDYCLSKLPQKLKTVFIARYMDDQKADKICKDYEISSSNYWVIIFRAKTLLRHCLEKKGITP